MGDVSRDFIRNRTVKDVFPKVINFLEKQAQIRYQFYFVDICKTDIVDLAKDFVKLLCYI